MRLSKLIDPRFKALIVSLQSEVIPLKGAFKLKGIVKAIDVELNKYEDLRKEALNKFGRKDDKGELVLDDKGNVQFDDAQVQDFMKELQDLVNLEVSIPTMSISDLGDKLSLSVQDLFLLEDVVVD